ncbi:hypothetical protein [Bacillus cereus group sp. BfR-BA-01349]|uniref:hypothetical protein n=1 Tax=Bacillus cereus group sp. BfR-BA-01349 TaxID=2920312 RepID=UPI001F57E63A
MKFSKKAMMMCVAGISIITVGTPSYASSVQQLNDTDGKVLKAGKAYCIRPLGIEPKANITVNSDGYIKLTDRVIRNQPCEYVYKLSTENPTSNQVIAVGETIQFEEWKKDSDGSYRKTKNILKYDGDYIRSTTSEYNSFASPYPTANGVSTVDKRKSPYSKFILQVAGNNSSEIRIHTLSRNEDYIWRVPYSVDRGAFWVSLQHKDESSGITKFEFKPVE